MDEITEIRFPENPHGVVTVNGIQYKVELVFTVKDYFSLVDVTLTDTNECIDFVKNLINTHVVGDVALNPEDIDEICCDEYIEQYLKVNDKLNDLYKKQAANLNNSIKFLLSQRDYMGELSKTISSIADGFTESMADMAKVCSDYMDLMVSEFSNTLKSIRSIFNDSLFDVLKQINDLIVDLPNLQISEEERKEIEERYALWGSYGWTSTDVVDTEVLDRAPLDINDANVIADKVMDKRAMALLFERIESLKTIKHSDYVEVKTSYDAHNYKACVLLAFSMIDSAIVHSQGKLRRNSGQNRRHGNKGIKKLMNKYRSEEIGYYLLSANIKNLFSCLNVVFMEVPNFEKQPKIINRHFVAHGMLHRKVTRRDAVQIILLLFNLYNFLEMMEIVNKDKE